LVAGTAGPKTFAGMVAFRHSQEAFGLSMSQLQIR